MIPVFVSGVVFHTCAMMGRYRWKFLYCSGDMDWRQRPTNNHTLSILSFPFGLCARVLVILKPRIVDKAFIAVPISSLAASEWNSSGTPLRATIS